MAYALVGSAGAVNSGTTSASPAFGQATSAGNLLIAWAAGTTGGTTPISVSGTGWSTASARNPASGTCVAIFYKANSGAGEAAPTFALTSGTALSAALAEFSGGATSAPADRTDGFSFGSTSPRNAAGVGLDAAAGELLVSAGSWSLSKAGTATTADTYNNGATPTTNLNNDAASTTAHYRFAWGTTTSNAVVTSDSQSNSSMNITEGYVIVCTFLLAGAGTTYTKSGWGAEHA